MQENIDYSSPNDGLGDKLRNAFIKVQNNFTELFNGKVDKIAGKGLSENDFTDADKDKLDGIEAGAQVNVNADFGENDPSAPGYILNKPPSMYASVGHFHISDLATQTTPLVALPNVPKKLTNDALGAYTELDYAPYGVSLEFWNTTNNQFDFTNLTLGDSMLIRVDLTATTTSANPTIKIYIKLGIGTASEYDLLIDSFNVKAITTDLHIIKDVSFSIDNNDWNNAPAEVYILSDDDAFIKVNGWYVPIVRKSVNIIDFNSDPLKLDKVTTVDVEKVYIKNADGTQGMKPVSEFGGGSSETILNYQRGMSISLSNTERVASTTSDVCLGFSENVTKSGSLLTGPFYMLTQNVTKTGTISKLRYRYFPDSLDLSIELRVYAFKQNKDSTSIYDCRLLLEETLTATTAYTVQKFEFLTADFLDANVIDGEFLAITAKKTGANNFFLLSQNLTIIY